MTVNSSKASNRCMCCPRNNGRYGISSTALPPHLAPCLRPWIAEGQYASVFDNSEDTLTFSHFQTFDFQGMDELYPQVLEPLLFYIFQRISQVVYDPALLRVSKQLWAD